MKKILAIYFVIAVVLITTITVSKAAFEDKGEVKSARFSVGDSQVKLLNDLSQTADSTNLLDEKEGPTFSSLHPGWVEDYALKLYNSGTLNFNVSSESLYATANDPDGLREYIFVEVFKWVDSNSNGEAESSELEGTPIAKKSILKWKTEGINLGELKAGEQLGVLLRFSSENMPSTKQGKEALYDFIFTATTDGVVQD